MTARRSLLTATAAGALLGALWFVPSANATAHEDGHEAGGRPAAMAGRDGGGPLTDAGGTVDTTPFLAAGTALLGLGAGFVAYSVRRERPEGADR